MPEFTFPFSNSSLALRVNLAFGQNKMTVVLTGKTQFESLPQEWQNHLVALQEKMVAEERICEEISHITDQPIIEISQRIESITEVPLFKKFNFIFFQFFNCLLPNRNLTGFKSD